MKANRRGPSLAHANTQVFHQFSFDMALGGTAHHAQRTMDTERDDWPSVAGCPGKRYSNIKLQTTR